MFKGRGAQIQPPNPFLATRCEDDFEHVAEDEDFLAELGRPPTEYLPDESQSIVAENDSPDVGFRYSVNPYRGCAHGCSYCYARPYHEYLGFSAGLDFETKVLVKHRAPELLREWLARPSWRPETIAFSGVTDCYQPAERDFELTRGCLFVFIAFLGDGFKFVEGEFVGHLFQHVLLFGQIKIHFISPFMTEPPLERKFPVHKK
jgi:hypothetical protein